MALPAGFSSLGSRPTALWPAPLPSQGHQQPEVVWLATKSHLLATPTTDEQEGEHQVCFESSSVATPAMQQGNRPARAHTPARAGQQRRELLGPLLLSAQPREGASSLTPLPPPLALPKYKPAAHLRHPALPRRTGDHPDLVSEGCLCPRDAPPTLNKGSSSPYLLLPFSRPPPPPAEAPIPGAPTSKLGRSRMRSQRGRTGRVRTKGDMPWEYSRLCLFMFRMCSLISFPGAPPPAR